MEKLDLTAPQLDAYHAQLCSSHKLDVAVKLQSLNGAEISDLTPRLLDGQVNIDSTAETTRQCTLTLSDPGATLDLDSSSPADGALYLDRMIAVTYGVYVDALARWVRMPIFTGPIVSMTRTGGDVEVSCLGKEQLAKGQCWRPLTFRKGHDVVDAIKVIMRDRGGESDFVFPDLAQKLPRGGLSLGRTSVPWDAATKLAESLDRQLYYDGSGTLRLRATSTTSVFTFSDGDDGSVLSDAEVSFDASELKNAVWVKGHKPRGKNKKAVTAAVIADAAHPLSPWKIGRTAAPRYLVEVINNPHLRTAAKCRQAGKNKLDDTLREVASVSFDALPIPHLDPLDVVRLSTVESSITFTLRQASIPLVHSGVMSVGTTKRVSPNRAHNR